MKKKIIILVVIFLVLLDLSLFLLTRRSRPQKTSVSSNAPLIDTSPQAKGTESHAVEGIEKPIETNSLNLPEGQIIKAPFGGKFSFLKDRNNNYIALLVNDINERCSLTFSGSPLVENNTTVTAGQEIAKISGQLNSEKKANLTVEVWEGRKNGPPSPEFIKKLIP